MANGKTSGYAGKVKNTGTQVVEPVYSGGKNTGKTVVKKGTDLRSGK